MPVAVFTAVLCLVNILAVATAKETYRVPTDQLGVPSKTEVTTPVSA